MRGGAPYPPSVLADMAVHLLAQLPDNEFDASIALGGLPHTGTRAAATDTPCCVVQATTMGSGPFYFGIDRRGYILVSARIPVENWPIGDGRYLPLRLTRWLVQAGDGDVVRHACDRPSCVRLSHLIVGTQGENLADARRRRRRSQEDTNRGLPSAPAQPSTAYHFRTPSAAESRGGYASEGSSLASPSKHARKRARRLAAASEAAESPMQPMVPL